MAQETIDQILEEKRKLAAKSAPPVGDEKQEDKFFSILGGDGLQEHFLELQFRNGLRTCFSYTDLQWFNFDPEAKCIDLDFGGFLVTLKGHGLCPKLFNGFKQKRVAWVKESDVELQQHAGNETFIEEIVLTPPKGFAEEEPETPTA